MACASPVLLAPSHFNLYSTSQLKPIPSTSNNDFSFVNNNQTSNVNCSTSTQGPSSAFFLNSPSPVQLSPAKSFPSSFVVSNQVNKNLNEKYAGASFLTAPSPALLPKPVFHSSFDALSVSTSGGSSFVNTPLCVSTPTTPSRPLVSTSVTKASSALLSTPTTPPAALLRIGDSHQRRLSEPRSAPSSKRSSPKGSVDKKTRNSYSQRGMPSPPTVLANQTVTIRGASPASSPPPSPPFVALVNYAQTDPYALLQPQSHSPISSPGEVSPVLSPTPSPSCSSPSSSRSSSPRKQSAYDLELMTSQLRLLLNLTQETKVQH